MNGTHDSSIEDRKSSKKQQQLFTGKPLQVIEVLTEEGRPVLSLHNENLNTILLHKNVHNRKVSIISVAGAFRKGKSFLLNFFIRYLSNQDSSNWLGNRTAPLQGFSWCGGSESHTTGILMWSEPFLCTNSSGEEIAVLLMDTQGSFDSRSTVRDCATVFALSTMLSSVQVYNISSNIQEDHLQHLQLFTEYGRLALERGAGTPFQRLQFLVRDWSYPYEHEYGAKGGDALLKKRLVPDSFQPPELQSIRKHLWSCFSEIRCFLMPHPGLEVAGNPKFDGRLADIQQNFVDSVSQLVPYLLARDNLVIKEVNGRKIVGKDLLQYFTIYTKIFQTEELPEPKSVFQAIAEADHLVCISNSKDLFTKELEKICGADQPYMDPLVVDAALITVRQSALNLFDERKKMGDRDFSQTYRTTLEADLDALAEQFAAQNQAKNVFGHYKTPLTLIGVGVVIYVLWSLFAMLGLGSVVILLQVAFLLLLGALGAWTYCSFTGEYHEVLQLLDTVAQILESQVIRPLLTMALEKAISGSVQRAALGSQSVRRPKSSKSRSSGSTTSVRSPH